MATAPDCLTSLLGLAPKQVPCFPLPTDPAEVATITVSETGLYLTLAEGLELRPSAGQTAAIDLYTRMSNARALAVVQVRAALEAGRGKAGGVPLYAQRGVLGGLGNGQLMPVGTRALMQFQTNARREGAWRITSLQLFTDQAVADVPLLLDGVEKAKITTNAASGTAVLNLLIPLDGGTHTLEAILPPGVRVKANNFFAGCFSCQAGSPWAVSVKNNLQNVTATTPGNGFAISVQEVCTAAPDFLCFATGKDDGQDAFRYPDLARHVALALLYKTAELFTGGLLSGSSTNRYTMLEPKMLDGLIQRYNNEATTRLAWLNSPEGLGQVQHPCYLGPPATGPRIIRTT